MLHSHSAPPHLGGRQHSLTVHAGCPIHLLSLRTRKNSSSAPAAPAPDEAAPPSSASWHPGSAPSAPALAEAAALSLGASKQCASRACSRLLPRLAAFRQCASGARLSGGSFLGIMVSKQSAVSACSRWSNSSQPRVSKQGANRACSRPLPRPRASRQCASGACLSGGSFLGIMISKQCAVGACSRWSSSSFLGLGAAKQCASGACSR